MVPELLTTEAKLSGGVGDACACIDRGAFLFVFCSNGRHVLLLYGLSGTFQYSFNLVDSSLMLVLRQNKKMDNPSVPG